MRSRWGSMSLLGSDRPSTFTVACVSKAMPAAILWTPARNSFERPSLKRTLSARPVPRMGAGRRARRRRVHEDKGLCPPRVAEPPIQYPRQLVIAGWDCPLPERVLRAPCLAVPCRGW